MTETGKTRPDAPAWRVGEAAMVVLGVSWVLLAAFWSAPGMFTGDDFAYRAMIDAFAREGALTIDNGYSEYGADSLALRHMRVIDGRVVPQYPGGWGILAAPAYLLAGVRGVFVMNAVAAALTLGLVWQTARALFLDRRIATTAALIWGLSSYMAEYALGFWPHASGAFFSTAALAAVATGWRAGGAAEMRGALIAGLALGIAINIRVDAIIMVVPLGVWLLGAAARPYRALSWLAIGLVPGLAAAAAINSLKFGTLSPISYGNASGRASVSYYSGLLSFAVAGAVASLALGLPRVRAVLFRPATIAATALAAIALVLTIAPLRDLAARIGFGFWVLGVDFQAHPLPSWGLAEGADGTVRVQGLVKKAVLQSMPFLPVILLAIPMLVARKGQAGNWRAATCLCFLTIVLGILPFAYGNWHGGMANNMRYFLNVLPAAAILTAVALSLVPPVGRGRLAAAGVFATLAAGAVMWSIYRGDRLDVAAMIVLPRVIAVAVTVLVLATLLSPSLRSRLAVPLRGAVALGLVSAFVSGWLLDLQFTRQVRLRNAAMEAMTADLPPNALVVTYAASAAGFRLDIPEALTAETVHKRLEIGPDLQALIARAFTEGRPVFAQGERLVAGQMVDLGIARDPRPRYGIDPMFDLFQMSPPR